METFEIVGILAIVVWSITTHEVAHGWVALRCGDDTAKQLGRITLNPLPHIDPFLTIIMPTVLFFTAGMVLGGARPVPVVPGRMRHPRRDMAIVAAAGPISNILIGIALAAILAALVHSGFWADDTMGVTILGVAIFFNMILAAFNLFPLPPLDGSRVVAYFLRGEALVFWYRLERIGLFLLLGILLMAPALLWGFVGPITYFLLDHVAALFQIEAPMEHALRQLSKAIGGS
jgi:Zn-dependent protease